MPLSDTGIKRIRIKNYRCFDEVGIDIGFDSIVTALIGRNGRGKTAILEALDLLLSHDYLPNKISEKDFHCGANDIKDEIFLEAELDQPFFATLDLQSNTRQLESIVLPCRKISLTIKRRVKAEKVLDDPFVINKYVIPDLGIISESIYTHEGSASERRAARITKTESAKTGISYTIYFRLKAGDERTARVLGYQLAFNPNKLKGCPKAYYLDKNREKENTGIYSLMGKILTDLHWRYRKKSATAEQDEAITTIYTDLANRLRTMVDEKGSLVNKINEEVKGITSEEHDFSIDFMDLEQPYKHGFITCQEGKKVLMPQLMGSGYSVLVAYALLSYVVTNEKMPIIMLIDEPEMHLHVDWQKKFYDMLTRQSGLQVIYATQSENFVSLKYWHQIRVINKNQLYPLPELLLSEVSSTDGRVGTYAEYLDDYARRNLHVSLFLKENLELLFTKKTILVEGPAEKYAIPKLLSFSDMDLSKHSLSIIPVWGKGKMKQYQMLCKCFGIDYFTLFDQDLKPGDTLNNETENSAIEANINERKYFKFSTSFEDKLGVHNFSGVVNMVDNLSDASGLDTEITSALQKIKAFINDRAGALV